MATCEKCGVTLEEGRQFCGNCGTAVGGAEAPKSTVDNLKNLATNTKDETGGMDPADIETNKVMGGLAYFLFFLPLLACPNSKYGRFHANQALVLVILCVAFSIISSILTGILLFVSPTVFGIVSIIFTVLWIGIGVLGVLGLINGFTGKAKELPIIGKIRIIK